MRKIIKLPLTLASLMIIVGGMGASTVLAAPASSGTPTSLSSYGTLVIGTTFTPSGTQYYMNLYVFSTNGPFYVQKVNMRVTSHLPNNNLIFLESVICDGSVLTNPQCAQVTHSAPYTWGELIAVTPSTLIDPSGARAVPAASGVQFILSFDHSCGQPVIFPTSISLVFEATILAPTAATVSICVNEGSTPLSSCPSASS